MTFQSLKRIPLHFLASETFVYVNLVVNTKEGKTLPLAPTYCLLEHTGIFAGYFLSIGNLKTVDFEIGDIKQLTKKPSAAKVKIRWEKNEKFPTK